jgi:hypothetical protein
MRRKLLFLLSFFLIAIAWHAQQLVIEVTTDKYPQETSWKFYNSNKEIVGHKWRAFNEYHPPRYNFA